MKDSVTNQTLYTEILKIHEKIDELVTKRITPLEIWKAELAGKIAVMTAVFAFGFSFISLWVKDKFFKNV